MTADINEYVFENGAKPINPDFFDLDYTFENVTKPEAPKTKIITALTDCLTALENK